MIEAKVTEHQEVQTNPTPEVITISGIINDLDNGIDRDGLVIKYGLTKAEVKTMFMHPALKGKRVKKNRVKELRFTLVDDVTPQVDPNQISIPVDDLTPPTMEDTYAVVEEQQAEQFGFDDCIDCPDIAETKSEIGMGAELISTKYSETNSEAEHEFNNFLDNGNS